MAFFLTFYIMRNFKPFIFTLLIAITTGTYAENVDKSDAALVARNFFFEKAGHWQNLDYNQIKLSNCITEKIGEDITYYIFNVNNSGYVIVSADDRSYPVLAYSLEGIYQDENKPENFSHWMKGYANQILCAAKNKTAVDNKTKLAWKHWKNSDPSGLSPLKNEDAVSPLLSSTWDQGSHYNALCPADAAGPSGHVYAGCVATAMAQIMYYWRYPLQGNGTHGYYSDYGYLSADFGNTTYQWENMTNSISANGNESMATLLYHCGVAINMMYSPNGSGAYSEDAAQALKTYFNYSGDLELLEKDSYSQSDWANILKSNLDQHHPMYYDGYGSGGHAFNVDGYQGDDYFHFNWGWSGSYNGYFYLDNLNPGGQNFTQGQGAIVNFVPGDDYPYYCNDHQLNYNEGTIDDGSGPVMSYQTGNNCSWAILPNDTIASITLSFEQFATVQDFDWVTVYDGADTNAPVLGRFSGTNIPPSVSSTGDKMYITFTTTSNNPLAGWSASYSAPVVDFCNSLVTLNSTNGTFTDGSGTYNYHNGTICKWKIAPPNASSIQLQFNSFSTEEEKDFVRVFDYSTQQLLETYSGNEIPEPLNVNTSALLVVFFTDSQNNASGWDANYTSTTVGICNPEEEDAFLSVYPNPAEENLFITFPSGESQCCTMELYSSDGVRVYKSDYYSSDSQNVIALPVKQYATGLYFLKMKNKDQIFTKKVVIK